MTVLHQPLAHQLGADADLARGHTMRPMLDQLEERSAELEADNHTLRKRVAQLEGELSERTDTLEAARTMKRELMNELNRNAPNNPGAGQQSSVRR